MERTLDTTTMQPGSPRTGGFPDADWRTALRKPLVIGLAALLVVQLALALLLGRGGMAPASDSAPLLDLDIATVNEILIESGDGERVRIARAEDGWVLPDLGDFPAGAGRVEQLLDDLDGISRPLPVATSADARRRFRVADDAFERRLTLRGGGDEATLMIGDSPGFRRLFARVDGEEAVYDLRLGLFDLAADADRWIDRGRLQFDRGEIERIGVSGAEDGDWALVRAENGWSLETTDDPIDQTLAESLVNAVATVGYSGLLVEDDGATFDLDAPERMLVIARGDQERRYRLAPIAESEDYALRRDGEPHVYRIGPFDAEMLLTPSREELLAVGEVEDAEAGTPAAPSAPAAGFADGAMSSPEVAETHDQPTETAPAGATTPQSEAEAGPSAE